MPGRPPRTAKEYVQSRTPRFQDVYSQVQSIVRRRFPLARSAFDHGMPGWRVPCKAAADGPQGTIDPNFVHIFLVERKNGITVHLWDPGNFGGLERRRVELTKAGFKVMRGCLQFNRKAEFPYGPLAALLDGVRV